MVCTGFGVAIIFFTLIIPFSFSFMEMLLMQNQAFIQTFGSTAFFRFILFLAMLFGPFPNFSRTPGSYGIMHNSDLLYKVILSFPLWIGAWKIFKTFNYKYYAMVIYVILGLLAITLYGMSLNFRYQVTSYPLMLPIIAYAFNRKIKKNHYYSYMLFSVAIIMMYNNR
jgi:hypothetical protein